MGMIWTQPAWHSTDITEIFFRKTKKKKKKKDFEKKISRRQNHG